MPLNFPSNPAVNDQYTFAGRTWVWNGSAWDSYNPGITFYVSRLNGFTGGITLAQGSNVTISSANNVITISSTGGGGGGTGVTGATGPTGPQGNTGATGPVGDYVISFNGLTGAVTGVTTSVANIFTALNTFNAGISASGSTFSGNIVLQNGETIRNTADGRIDFMPGPVSGTTYGLYMHFTNWGQGAFGPQFGTVNSSSGVLDQASLLYGSDLVLTTAKAFSLNNTQTCKFTINSSATSRNNTLNVTVPVGTGYTGAAFALIDASVAGAVNRAPTASHSHPNFYIYSAGSANANDFIRFEHDRTNANIVTGQTSGILIQPGSGWLGVNGGISASGGTFSALTRFTGGITASTLYVTRGATFGNLTATDIYSTNLSAVTQYTDGLLPYTGTVVAININGNLTTIGDYGFEGDSDFLNNGTYISVNDTTQTVRLKATNGIDNNGSFLNRVTAPSFADTYSFNETYRTTTTATTANQTIATIDSVYVNNEIPPVMNYPAFEVTISARDTVLNKTEMLKMLVVQDGTNTVNTQYGLIRTGATGPVSSYSTTLSGTPRNLLIRATPLSANSTVFTTTVRTQLNG